ncbi:DUF6573 family protein [Desulfovibrio desulfuricans]|uniref:DUF6573 family protein n=1 Tax=Desulfovibrio desulfuricans TaxID=876 RepID=UPI003984590E
MECNDWKLICCYTRKRAIDDGIMVDVSDFVSDFGFIVPVAITNNLFTRYIQPTNKLSDAGQSSESRMIDLLVVMMIKLFQRPNTEQLSFNVSFDMEYEEKIESKLVQILAVIGQGDAGEPVLTIMLPEDF